MAGISSLGVGSGIDLNSILSSMMEIKRQPLYSLQSQQKQVKTQISDYGSLKSAVSSFKDALDKLKKTEAFNTYKASSSDEKILSVSTDAKASAGSFDITVTELAKAHKMASKQFVNANATVGAGELSITVGSKTLNLTIDADDTLANVRDAINKNANNPGVSATIINEDGGSRLMLTSKDTGLAKAMTFGGDLNLFDIGSGAQEVSAAKDAAFKIDSFDMTSASNSVTNAIDGVTLSLKEVGSSKIAITRDDEAITKLVQGVVDSYNTLNAKISSLQSGSLRSDSSLNSIHSSFLAEVGKPAQLDGLKNLFDVGITRDKFGKFNLDSSKLKKALETNSDQVANLFADKDSGFATRLSDLAKTMLAHDGVFKSRENGFNDRLKFLKNSEDRMSLRLTEMEQRMKKQFSNLDSTMSKLNSTGAFLSSQLASLR